MEIALDNRETLIVAILVFFLGKYLVSRVQFLRDYNIPQPVAGGVLASLITGALYFLAGTEVQFDLALRDMLLITFFATVGLSSRVETLIQGGSKLLTLLVLAVIYLVLQNLTGIAVAVSSGLEANVGLVGGSVSLSGGHGTAIAWAPVFEQDFGLAGAAEIGVACATFGLVLGGVIGGPIAQWLISRHGLQASSQENLSVGLPQDVPASEVSIDVDAMLRTILVIAWSIGLGLGINEALTAAGLQLPGFVTALFAGIVLTNTVPHIFRKVQWPTGSPSLALVSELSLGLFLAMSLMSLQLWTLAELAGSIIAMLIAQVLVIVLYVIYVVFPMMGRNYDAAVISGGYAGLGLGATPTAIANMEAITQKFGASPTAFIVVPLVGAFFIDIANSVVITQFLELLNRAPGNRTPGTGRRSHPSASCPMAAAPIHEPRRPGAAVMTH